MEGAHPKKKNDKETEGEPDEEQIASNLGGKREHTPDLLKNRRNRPRCTPATLLRAMETAGKQVEDDELRS